MSYLGEQIPKSGFGLMRLPMLGTEVDVEQVKEMVDLFLDAGFTYFDTAYGYINGKSEEAIKVALVDRYPRESFQLATKLPAWAGPKTAEEAQQMFYTSLERTGAGYFDFYLLHNLGDTRTESFDRFGIWDFVKARKEEGLIKHLGFSFHDSADKLDQILTLHPEVEFVQLQINYADWEDPKVQSRKCHEVARKHGKPVIIMEPVKGGSLANLPESVAKVFQDADPEASLSSWAIRFAASVEGLIVALSGMSNVEQMKDNLDTMECFVPLTEEEQKLCFTAADMINQKIAVPCTACSYCTEGCPQNIPIPGYFSLYNEDMREDLSQKGWTVNFTNYERLTEKFGKASACIACGQCEDVCPQHLPIIETLKKVAAYYE